MTIPKHVSPGGKDRVARAPYNFVPLPGQVLTVEKPLSQDRYHQEMLTGKLVCTLTTASPLYVRAARTLKQYQHKNEKGEPEPITPSQPFYGESEETLLIPGSSLRGMLRTLVEVISQSRIAPVTDKPLFFRTVDDTSIGKAYRNRMTGEVEDQGWYSVARGGYMELRRGDYYIRPALTIMGVQHFKVEEAIARNAIPELMNMSVPRNNGRWLPNKAYKGRSFAIWFKPNPPTSHKPNSYTYFADVTEIAYGTKQPGKGWVEGWLMASGWVPSRKGPGKHRHWIIGPPDPDDSKLIQVSDDDIELYKDHGGLTKVKESFSVLPAEGKHVPCFYTLWEDQKGRQRVAFGHTGMFRLPYEQTPADLVPDELKGDETCYDLAEAMFGFVDPKQKGKRQELAGRVFVTDGVFKGDPKTALLDEVTLSDQALSSPKPTTFQHYLTQDNPDDKDHLKHYGDEKTKTTLRGYKFYWHIGGEDEVQKRLSAAPNPRSNTNDKGNRFKPVKSGQTFMFDIHFENLRPEEFGALLWILDKVSDPYLYRLKLGMGKPFGLGSVAISYTTHLTDRVIRYDALFSGESWNLGALPRDEQEVKLQMARKAFNQFVTGDEKTDIDTLPHIRELLVMLDWKNCPSSKETSYMNLEEFAGRQDKSDANEQKNPRKLSKRPVLPPPSKVVNSSWYKNLPDKAPRPSTSGPKEERKEREYPKPQPAPPSELPADLQPAGPIEKKSRAPILELPKPVKKHPSELVAEDVILATIDDAPAQGEIILIPEIHGPEDYATIPPDLRGVSRYKEGKQILVRVLSVEGDDKNGWYIEVEPIG